MTKSPFILLENALETKACNDIIASLQHSEPNYIDEEPVLTTKSNKLEELRLQPFIDDLLDYAEPYYGFETAKIHPFIFEWYPTSYKSKYISSDSYIFFDGKWIKSKQIDFTILLFLSTEINTNGRFSDTNIEHFGGGLQFPTHNFTLHAKAGDVIMFPADKHFLNTIGEIKLGNMNLIRVLITAKNDYKYNRRQFPGTYKDWF